MDTENISSDLVRGHIDTMILRVLMDGDNYGYEIIKSISQNSEEKYELKEPSLYTSLKRLEKLKYVESYWGNESQGGRRKYYKITNTGKEFYANALSAWETARDIIDKLIKRGPSHE